MKWLNFFTGTREEMYVCLICANKFLRKDCVEIKYRYGSGEGHIGTAYMCSECSNTNIEDEDHEDVESI
jgi:DNA-directed RNA polymerase subunit RPC12/RpoP